jgi:hypothetical protein
LADAESNSILGYSIQLRICACPGPIHFKGMRASPKRHENEIDILEIVIIKEKVRYGIKSHYARNATYPAQDSGHLLARAELKHDPVISCVTF